MTSDHRHVRTLPGESAPFHFESLWTLEHRLDIVFASLLAVDDWPVWWPGIDAARIDGSGSRSAMTVRGPFGIRLLFDLELIDIVDGVRISFSADGDLRGSGELRVLDSAALTTSGSTRPQHIEARTPLTDPVRIRPQTQLAITWCVVTRRRLLRVLRPMARGGHDRVMAAGDEGLNGWLSRSERS